MDGAPFELEDDLSEGALGGVERSGAVFAVDAEFSEGDSDEPLDLSPPWDLCR